VSASLAHVKEQMGHSSINVTGDVYGHLSPFSNRQVVDRLDDGNKMEIFKGFGKEKEL